jgi:hypothetical protein
VLQMHPLQSEAQNSRTCMSPDGKETWAWQWPLGISWLTTGREIADNFKVNKSQWFQKTYVPEQNMWFLEVRGFSVKRSFPFSSVLHLKY